jgi:competence protein ComFB
MSLGERYNLEAIRNETAALVYARVEKLLEERADICHCEVCVLDLVAFTLNRITPRYTTSMLGDLHPNPALTRKLQIEIDLALRAALGRLKEHPHHD